MATNIAKPSPPSELSPHLQRLRRFVSDHPVSAALQPHWTRWISASKTLPEFIDSATGAASGTAYRDLGDVTPYLWLAGQFEAVGALHRAAARSTRDGLLTAGGKIRAFDNHDYVLSFYLLFELDGDAKWREAYLAACHSLAGKFFATPDPPEFFDLRTGKPSRRLSAFGLGLLELFCCAHRLAPADGWLDVCDSVIAAQLERLEARDVHLVPRVGFRVFDRAFHDWRPNRVFARLFKDNSNLLFSLIQRCGFPRSENARLLASMLWSEIERRFLAFDDGWVRTELRFDYRGRANIGCPLLVGNAVVCSLLREMARSPALAHHVRSELVETVTGARQRQLLHTGFLPMARNSDWQHLDVTVDFVTAVFLSLYEQGRVKEAGEVAHAGVASLRRHVTPFGYTTLATADGPFGEICVKYNFLLLKLLICAWLADEGGGVPAAARNTLADTFLIDR